ncbi:HIG1 domain-containing protein [Fusarium keratoplasticum]|uniref:HIG1 domain-containing protein n=1 Tax=Fusarium keratoplasticum TaxID=1328300 RepID=A0ACC0RF68_9HYPO|nr:HIG1 domain-containing protein [Fusarium keratoplasticum]KAI8684756.1 HIG1 domain-containing protein [Fusarium keratoplasticum]KAI8688864.1 HIG1 domain-containing protein [Fusarium keratoplasticum]
MKILTKEEEEAHYAAVVKGGLIGGTIGIGVGVGGVLFASRRYTAFRGLTIPFRTFLVTSAGTFGAIINADRWSMAFQKEQNPMNFYQDETQRVQQITRENQTAYERFMEYGKENRYSIVFISWLASMGLAFALVSRSPMNTANKVVQARVYAQGLTLAVLIVSAVFEMNDAKSGSGRWQTVMVIDPDDPEHKHLIEKRIHKEEYEGQDLWKDMVAAEERRLAAKKASETKI